MRKFININAKNEINKLPTYNYTNLANTMGSGGPSHPCVVGMRIHTNIDTKTKIEATSLYFNRSAIQFFCTNLVATSLMTRTITKQF